MFKLHFACFVIDILVPHPQGALILCNPLKLSENEVLFSVHGGNFIAVDVLDPGSDIVVVSPHQMLCNYFWDVAVIFSIKATLIVIASWSLVMSTSYLKVSFHLKLN